MNHKTQKKRVREQWFCIVNTCFANKSAKFRHQITINFILSLKKINRKFNFTLFCPLFVIGSCRRNDYLANQLNRNSEVCAKHRALNFFFFFLVLPSAPAYRTDNSNRRKRESEGERETPRARSVFIGSRDFIQISRHSIKQSIYSGFAFAGTSRFSATSTTCKFAGIYSNSSRLDIERERKR